MKIEQERKAAERQYFVEEQNVRRSLGPALWEDFCNGIEIECKHANQHVGETFLVNRTPVSLTVRHLPSGRTLRLEYQEAAACIAYRESGKPTGAITFRVNKTAAPSLTLMYNGAPYVTKELAEDLIIGLSQG